MPASYRYGYQIPALTRTPKGNLVAFCQAYVYQVKDYNGVERNEDGGGTNDVVEWLSVSHATVNGREKGYYRDHHHLSDGNDGWIDIVARRSTDGGHTWGDLQVLCRNSTLSEHHSCQQPTPIADAQTGRLLLLLSLDNFHQFLVESADDGVTWTPWRSARNLDASLRQPEWGLVFNGLPGGIQLRAPSSRTGRLLACSSSYRRAGDRSTRFSFSVWSDDHGDTWHMSAPIGPMHTTECSVAQSFDGSGNVYLYTRIWDAGRPTRGIALSTDGGSTWTNASHLYGLPDSAPDCEGSFLSVQVGGSRNSDSNIDSYNTCYFTSAPYSSQRQNLSVIAGCSRRSNDGAPGNWDAGTVVNAGPSSYSALAFLPLSTSSSSKSKSKSKPKNLAWAEGGGDNSGTVGGGRESHTVIGTLLDLYAFADAGAASPNACIRSSSGGACGIRLAGFDVLDNGTVVISPQLPPPSQPKWKMLATTTTTTTNITTTKSTSTASATTISAKAPPPLPPPSPPPPPSPLPRKWPYAGITFTGGRYCPNVTLGSPTGLASLRHLASTGANWVSIVVTQYVTSVDTTTVFPMINNATQGPFYVYVTPSDADVRAAIREARHLGLKVLLKPHIDPITNAAPTGNTWRGDIGRNFTQQQWNDFFESYWRMLGHYARMAEGEGAHMLSMNCELITANNQTQWWRELVRRARGAFPSGQLTASPNGHGHEYWVEWWDVLDLIGVDMYDHVNGTSVPDMVHGWDPILDGLEALSKKWGNKPLILTETGACSGPGGECDRLHASTRASLQLQAAHYESLFLATKGRRESWFKGAFWWNWPSDYAFGPGDICLTPAWKPAEQVLRKYYRATQPQPRRPSAQEYPPMCVGVGACTF